MGVYLPDRCRHHSGRNRRRKMQEEMRIISSCILTQRLFCQIYFRFLNTESCRIFMIDHIDINMSVWCSAVFYGIYSITNHQFGAEWYPIHGNGLSLNRYSTACSDSIGISTAADWAGTVSSQFKLSKILSFFFICFLCGCNSII